MRARQELHDALHRNTELQEKARDAKHRLAAAATERQALEERLSQSSATGAALQKSLDQAEAGRAEAVTAATDGLRAQLREAAADASRLLEHLAERKASYEILNKSLSDALESRAAAADEAARLQAEVSKTSEDCLALLRKAASAAAARLAEVSAARDSLEARVGELEARLEGHREEAAGREAESARLHGVLREVEEDHAQGKRTVDELRRELADIHGISAELGEKLISVLSEKNDAEMRLEVCEGALAASGADRRRLERVLTESEAVVEGLRKDKNESCREIDELQEVGFSVMFSFCFCSWYLLLPPARLFCVYGEPAPVVLLTWCLIEYLVTSCVCLCERDKLYHAIFFFRVVSQVLSPGS